MPHVGADVPISNVKEKPNLTPLAVIQALSHSRFVVSCLMMNGFMLSCDFSISVKSVLYFQFFVAKETDKAQHFNFYWFCFGGITLGK